MKASESAREAAQVLADYVSIRGVKDGAILESITQAEARGREQGLREAAGTVGQLKRLTPYDFNDQPCSVTMRRAAAAILSLIHGEPK